ncbi:MAG: hypothetical protein M3464_15205 [Chloroflexota bacterium]|nr:hypothetical protein [Chloroflexota bacterium]
MSDGQDTYGVSNVEYDIIMTLGSLLEGIEMLEKYARDADAAGDTETATVFRTLRESNRSAVQQLRSGLTRHLK